MGKIIEIINLYRRRIIIYSITIIFILLCIIIYYFNVSNKKEIVNKGIKEEVKEALIKEDEKESLIKEEVIQKKALYVDIKGSIKKPGVYKLDEDKRVIDVINLAGGLNDDANTSMINLSKKIKDEMVIIIYNKEQVQNIIKVKEDEKIIKEECHNNTYINNDSCTDSKQILKNNEIFNDDTESIDLDGNISDEIEEFNEKISINEADMSMLIKLPGIGESKAQNIIEYREKNGNFKTIEDIKNVSGIGEAIFEKIKEYIKV